MKDDTFTRLMAALPAHSALAGIRAYILKEGMEGNLDAATAAFHQLWNCEGNEGTKAELAEFLVARYAYRGQLDTARNIYALLVSLGTRADVLQARAATLHILTCMLMEVRLHEAVTIWMEYIHLPIRPNFKKFAAKTGHALLVQAVKNSDTRLSVVVSSSLRALAQEIGDAGISGYILGRNINTRPWRRQTQRSGAASATSCWPEAGRVTPTSSTSAPVAGPTIPCGPRAPTPSRTTASRSPDMAGKTDTPPKMLGANGFRYREQFGVIVICKDEAEHKAVYERLKAQGYKCKVVRV